MPNYQALVITAWTGSGTSDDEFRPQLEDHYPLITWEDVTGQLVPIPEPNLYTVRAVCAESTLAAIQDDSSYLVLWTMEDLDAQV